MFVRSPAFQRLLGSTYLGADFIRDPGEASYQIAGLLLGAPVFPGKAFLSLVINGAFDADKLDYMRRDAMMAGVPSTVDVARIVEKVHCISVPPNQQVELLASYRRWAGLKEDEPALILALPRSATTTLDELAVTRTVLFDKVYFHQKVRVLELMAQRLLETQHRSLTEWFGLSDEGLLAIENEAAAALRDRRLLKRAFFVASPKPDDTPSDGAKATEEDSPVDEGWRRLRRDQENGKVDVAILEQVLLACRILGLDEEILKADRPLLDLPDAKRMELDQFAFIGDDFGDLETANAALTGQRAEIAKRIVRASGLVYSAEGTQVPVFFAAHKVLTDQYSQQVSIESYSKTKLEPEELVQAEKKLRAASFLAPGPPLVAEAGVRSHRERALERFLRTALPRIEERATVFGGFQSPGAAPVSVATIVSYLRQFKVVARARSMLRILEAVDFKDRKFFSGALEKNLRRALEKGEIDYVCPLGGMGDSSAILSYFMNDLPPDLRRPVVQLEIALENNPKHGVLLWDDFCGLGGHSITTLAQWSGDQEKVADLILDEYHVGKLTEQRLTALKNTRVHIAFALARASGIANLRDACARLGLSGFEVDDAHHVESDVDEVFSSSSQVLPSAEEREDLKAFLTEVGRSVLGPKLRHKSKIDQRLLGYGNTARLLVFFYNVPTVSLTALWATGETWMALFPRRAKPSIERVPTQSTELGPTESKFNAEKTEPKHLS